MLNLQQRILAFEKLGYFIKEVSCGSSLKSGVDQKLHQDISELIEKIHIYNGWFTKENVINALRSIGESLEKEKLEKWISGYDLSNSEIGSPKNIGVIMAGNIPMVGFYDLLYVLVSGNQLIAKLSSDDKYLLPFITKVLIEIEPKFKDHIFFTESMKGVDAMIATGSNNSSRYFEHYFGKHPHIIRKNRHSLAVITGTETNEELGLLGNDLFQYFGLGCRNVSKFFVPEGYVFNKFFEAIFGFADVVNNNKYANNYDYNKTVYLLNGVKLLDNGFLLLKEDIGLSSPVGVLYYEFYKDEESLVDRIRMDAPYIQCIVSKNKKIKNVIGFGETQCPGLADYADGVDVMKFLLNLNHKTNATA